MSDNVPVNEVIDPQEMTLVKKFLGTRVAFLFYGFLIALLGLGPYRNNDTTALDTCRILLKDKTDMVNKLIDENRSDALSREKSLISQRDTFIEMIREHLLKLKLTPAEPVRYKRIAPAEGQGRDN